MKSMPAEKRTNVRFLIPWLIMLHGCADLSTQDSLGTSATAPRHPDFRSVSYEARQSPCGEGTPAICATLDAEQQCGCVLRSEVDRFLGGFGAAAWPGARE